MLLQGEKASHFKRKNQIACGGLVEGQPRGAMGIFMLQVDANYENILPFCLLQTTNILSLGQGDNTRMIKPVNIFLPLIIGPSLKT